MKPSTIFFRALPLFVLASFSTQSYATLGKWNGIQELPSQLKCRLEQQIVQKDEIPMYGASFRLTPYTNHYGESGGIVVLPLKNGKPVYWFEGRERAKFPFECDNSLLSGLKCGENNSSWYFMKRGEYISVFYTTETFLRFDRVSKKIRITDSNVVVGVKKTIKEDLIYQCE